MDEELLANVTGGIDTMQEGGSYWETFADALLAGGAANIPALAQLVTAAKNKQWTQVSALIPKYLSYPEVTAAVNAANATLL